MKKAIIKTVLSVIIAFPTIASNAQTNAGQAVSGAQSIMSAVIGTTTVSKASLEGTWIYTQPSMAFESESVMAALSSSPVANKGQAYLLKGLGKAGFTEGKVSVSFNADGTASMTIGGKTINGNYTVEGCNITVTYSGVLTGVPKTSTVNVRLTDNNMQLSMSAKKFLALVQTVSTSASSANTTLSTASSLMSSVNGMYVGLVFNRK